MLANVLYAVIALLVLACVKEGWDVYSAAPTPTAGAVSAQPSPGQPQALSGIAAKFDNHLFVIGADGNVHGLSGAKLAGVKYWAFYYSASWCPPCRAFTPDLVNFYNDFKPSHPNFELIFVGDDRSDEDMVNYMKGDSMPWPAVWFQDNDNPDIGAKKYMGSGIPDLVLVDDNGNVLSDSFSGSSYLGPRHVLDDIRQMVR